MLYTLLIYWYLYFCLCKHILCSLGYFISSFDSHRPPFNHQNSQCVLEINSSLLGFIVCFVFKITFKVWNTFFELLKDVVHNMPSGNLISLIHLPMWTCKSSYHKCQYNKPINSLRKLYTTIILDFIILYTHSRQTAYWCIPR